MSHGAQRDFIRLAAGHLPSAFRDCRVLEIGSLDINGSVREFFRDCQYVGLDVAVGPGVDVVCQGQDYDAPEGSFDTVISCETMEHNPFWRETLLNMLRICRPGGWVLLTCATTGRPEHGTTRTNPESSPLTVEIGWDYYRNVSARDLAGVVELGRVFSRHHLATNWHSYDLYFLGRKAGGEDFPADRWAALERDLKAFVASQNSLPASRRRARLGRTLGEHGFRAVRWLARRVRGVR